MSLLASANSFDDLVVPMEKEPIIALFADPPNSAKRSQLITPLALSGKRDDNIFLNFGPQSPFFIQTA